MNTNTIASEPIATITAPVPSTTAFTDYHIEIGGRYLTVRDIEAVARERRKVSFTDDINVLRRLRSSQALISEMVEASEPIYGVTTGFGGMANTAISKTQAEDLQNNLLWFLKTGAGSRLPDEFVRAAMLIRANALLIGASGIRHEIVKRFEIFLNEGITPHVYDLGSIGASGDLVPLGAIAGSLIGLHDSFKVDFRGREQPASRVLEEVGLPKMKLLPKEGLALVNGTAVMTGIAACCVAELERLLVLSVGIHSLYIQALGASNQPFHPFIHKLKPFLGQQWIAESMLSLIDSSQFIKDEIGGKGKSREGELIQDRYSVRCLPQFMGPMADGIAEICRQIEIEANSATDNPLIDVENRRVLNGGNFLGEYIGLGMDRARGYIGLLAKHLDVQIALLVSPELSNGLPASLVGNTSKSVNMGLKGLQITGNSIMPLLTFLGNAFVSHFPTHAEQGNQNINSQGFGAATLTMQSISLFKQYLAVALIFGVQAVDLRSHRLSKSYDPRRLLSPESVPLYEAAKAVIGRPPSATAPLVYDDCDQPLDQDIRKIVQDLDGDRFISQALADYELSFQKFKAKAAPRNTTSFFPDVGSREAV